ncbi:hypothetical protein [Paenarthrobacter sp.]|uniref:hypothetical protein n=1 Tax=Paenarthrobacter sp. TaxID=1931993 RepID=UPI002811DA3E|nr:hypothetical protein [Paenarthrobacter sp.]
MFDPDLAFTAEHLSERITAAAQGDASTVLATDVETLHGEVRALLTEVSEELRASYGAEDKPRLDAGRQPGADARLGGADLMGADLSSALYLTQPQINAAEGDPSTQLPHDSQDRITGDCSGIGTSRSAGVRQRASKRGTSERAEDGGRPAMAGVGR